MNIDEMLEAVKNQITPSAKEEAVKEIVPKVQNTFAGDINLKIAKELISAVEKAAQIMNLKVVVAVVNKGANLVALEAMDDSYIASIQAAWDKAYTAVALKMSTQQALKESRGGALDGLTNTNGLLLLGGGIPLIKDGVICGAIGVSGGSKEQDIILAETAGRIFQLID